jgi:hypothetical protein
MYDDEQTVRGRVQADELLPTSVVLVAANVGSARERWALLQARDGASNTRGVYRILSVGSDFHEICDECGFHGGTLDVSAAVARIRALPDRWSEVMSQDEERVRARPEPDTWCAVEYAQHVISAIVGIEWAARVFAAGRTPDWDELPEDSLPGVFEHDTHNCDRFDIAATLASLGAVATSMAAFAESLTPDEQAMVALYSKDQVINTTAVIRHALHDAEHHLLDIRRGIARQQLGS